MSDLKLSPTLISLKMSKKFLMLVFWLILLPCLNLTSQEQNYAGTKLRRFALIAGSNDGGPERVKLLYAASDARAFAKVMQELGGVNAEDSLILVNPDSKAMEEGLQKMKQILTKAASRDQRQEFIFYYSGHSDEEGLLLGSEKYTYKHVREDITNVPANVRVVILDSCSSGALTRSKGGIRQPAFLLDAASEMKGQAILTSSSQKEAAQESDTLKASFFTHYLISGLRGAADATGDGMVTLNEAYHYAFKETLASTEKTQLGPQHPAYDINLSGTGDLVLTDLREATARVIVASEISGRIFFRDEKGQLAVELAKQPGQVAQLGLVPGHYQVIVDSPTGTLACELTIKKEAQTLLEPGILKPFTGVLHTARGDNKEASAEGEETNTSETTLDPATSPSETPPAMFSFMIIPGLSFPDIFQKNKTTTLAFGLLLSIEENIRAMQMSTIINMAGHDLVGIQGAGIGNITNHDANGLQLAGIFNMVGSTFVGGQGACIFNIANKSGNGLQYAGIFNLVNGPMTGLQGTGIFNISGGNQVGVQLAGVFNVTSGSFTGVQGGGAANITSDLVTGLQMSSLFNISGKSLTGIQGSGLLNVIHGSLTGIQMAGLLNAADVVNGVQAGTINIASGKVSGLQVGVINICDDMDGIPLGLINIVRKGQHGLDFWIDTDSFVHTGLRMGSKNFYTLVTGSYMLGSAPTLWSGGMGLGASLFFNDIYFNLEALNSFYCNDIWTPWKHTPDLRFIPEARLTGGVKLFSVLNLFVGCSAQCLIPNFSPDYRVAYKEQVRQFEIRPVFYAGLGIF